MALVASSPVMTCLEVPKQGVHHHRAERDIQPCHGSNPGEVAEGHRRWHEHGKDRDRHNEFGAQQRRSYPLKRARPGMNRAMPLDGELVFVMAVTPDHFSLRLIS